VPLRNEAVTEEHTDAGELRLVLPVRPPWWARPLARFLYVPKQHRIVLDEIGAYVWRLCDGKRSMRDIIQALALRYKLHPKEARVSLVAYLRQLGRRRLVGVAVLRTAQKPDPQER